MTSRRTLLVTLCAAALVVAGCSDESSSPGTTTTVAATTTTVAATSTTAAPTTTVAATTTTEAATTTTTIAPVVGLALSGAGLGDALFGADAEGVIEYVSSIIGAPTSDSGWQDPVSLGATCPGTEVRFVDWNDLYLFFSDDSLAASGARHFASFSYGPAFGPTLSPFGLTTDAGVGIGSTVAEIVAVYPAATINPDDGLSGATVTIGDGLFGFLTGTTDTDTVTAFVGGFGCGE
jgi:hypothetical protein